MTGRQERNAGALTAADVLRRYKAEDLPAFVEVPLDSVNQAGNFGEHPLEVAASRGRMDEIVALVDGGADVNSHGELGNTPLHEAVLQGHVEAVKFLLNRGASISAKNDFGETPLDLARSRGRGDIAAILVG